MQAMQDRSAGIKLREFKLKGQNNNTKYYFTGNIFSGHYHTFPLFHGLQNVVFLTLRLFYQNLPKDLSFNVLFYFIQDLMPLIGSFRGRLPMTVATPPRWPRRSCSTGSSTRSIWTPRRTCTRRSETQSSPGKWWTHKMLATTL